jgi:integrase
VTVAELLNSYRLTSGERQRNEDERHAHWWTEQLGDLPLDLLTQDRIQQQLTAMVSFARSEFTRNFYFHFLRRVCAWGVTLGHIPADPCTGIPLPKEKMPTLRVLTQEEEVKLCAALGAPWNLWVKFALLTGLKQSEQFSLCWRDVDLERLALLLPHPSTGGVVSLQMAPATLLVLRELKRVHPVSVWVFPDLRTPSRPANVHAFYVGRFESAIRRAGIPRCAWKDLRHTCGARLAQQGLPVREVTVLMRQREVRMAYHYRAWQPGQNPQAAPTKRPPAGSVFDGFTPDTLHAMLGRDIETEPLAFKELCQLYAGYHLGQRRGRGDFDRMYRQFWQPWADRRANSITRKEVRLWHATLKHSPSHANHGLTYLKALYNWALRMELVTCANPAWGHMRFREDSRERFLSAEEMQRFMDGLPHVSERPRAYLLLLLLTGCRMGEALQMRWADVDATSRLWRKPKTKNGTSHLVPLPLQVMHTIGSLPKTSDWVFTGQHGKPWSEASAQKMWGLVRSRWNLDDVRLHDLRRTCASYLAMSGENLPTIQSVVNHKSLAPTSIYARLNTKATDRALQTQADRLCSLASAVEVHPALTQEVTALQ